MKRAVEYVLAGMVAVLAGRWLAVAFGSSLRLQLVLSLGIAFCLVALAEWTMRLWLERVLDRAHPRKLQALAEEEPELQKSLANRRRSNEMRDWQWMIRSVTWSILAVGAPLTLVPWFRHGRLQADVPIDALDIGAVAAAVAGYMLLKRRALRNYRCPACDGTPRRLESPTPRFACSSCGVTWRVEP